MKTQKSIPLLFVIMGVVLVSISVAGIFEPLFLRHDIWWTPATMKESFDVSRDRVDIYIKDMPLADMLTQGALVIRAGSEQRILSKDDVSFRFNNYEKVKASKIPFAMLSSAIVMAGLISIAYGLMKLLVKRVKT